jgi:hypothetical protein
MISFLNENNQYYFIPVILFNLLYWTRKKLITFYWVIFIIYI